MNIASNTDFDWSSADFAGAANRPDPIARWSKKHRIFKASFDYGFAILSLPVVALIALALLILNPRFNPGPLLFSQTRMGMGGKSFRMWKFRTMTEATQEVRHHGEGVETHRITPLGAILRKTRLDETPNFINVLRGEMSVIGPRPDAWSHAMAFMSTVPLYQTRFRVKPGITGLAQIRAGYADCEHSIRRKARLDKIYVKKSRIKLELYIIYRTAAVMLSGFGAK